MADKSATIRVEGLAELRRELKRLDEPKFTDELKGAHNRVSDYVVDKAKDAASSPMMRKAARSLSSSRAAASARLSYGGAGTPFAMGAEFGSSRYHQFRPYLGKTGYFLYPTIRAEQAEVMHIYEKAVDQIVKHAFPD